MQYTIQCLMQALRQHRLDPTFNDMFNPFKMQLYNSLPDRFTRKQAVNAGVIIGLSIRTVDGYLKQLLTQHLLEKGDAYGEYHKLGYEAACLRTRDELLAEIIRRLLRHGLPEEEVLALLKGLRGYSLY